MGFTSTLTFLVLALGAKPVAASTLLAVFAHPDDEISIGPLLARAAAEGHDVHLVTVTSGQVGGANTEIPIGDELGAAREEEARCSARELGIHEPILLGFMDGDIADRSTSLPAIRGRLREILSDLEPDVLITWGPDGLSGHQDHRLVSVLTTEIFQEPGPKPRPQKLYYVALPASRVVALPESERGRRGAAVRDDFITTIVDGSGFLEPTFAAMQCRVTQWAPLDRMRAMFEDRSRLLEGRVHLRLALSTVAPSSGLETNVFRGLRDRD